MWRPYARSGARGQVKVKEPKFPENLKKTFKRKHFINAAKVEPGL